MKIEWLHKSDSSRLIIIFAGWSTGPDFYSDISHNGWDIVVAYGYSDLYFPSDILNDYSSIAVFAWSMGVYVASKVLDSDSICLAIAVNGTEFPADDNFGIPLSVFDGTANTLSERNLLKFWRRMAGDKFNSVKDRIDVSTSDIGQLRNELEFIRTSLADNQSRSFRWHRAYVSSADRIFPPAAQIAAWESNLHRPDIVRIDSPHFVEMSTIINGILPLGEIIGDRFRKAIPTYNAQASVQRLIAEKLANMCNVRELDKIIEIGPGTGIFSRMIVEKYNPAEITFVDLYPIQPYNIAKLEKYIVADAEDWIEKEAFSNPESRDAIVSASAIQWFTNPQRFFRNAARTLKPGGTLLCSTFLPGNLHELKNIAPFGLVYRRREELETYLKEYFKEFKISEETFPIEFSSPRETLRHLRHTGVGGSAHSSHPIGKLLSITPSILTYRPLFILAKT